MITCYIYHFKETCISSYSFHMFIMNILFFNNSKEIIKLLSSLQPAGCSARWMVCAVLLVWKIVNDCCWKDFFINNGYRAFSEVVQIPNEFCLVAGFTKDTVIYCMLCMCLLSQVMPCTEHLQIAFQAVTQHLRV